MEEKETFFDINAVLISVYVSLESIRAQKQIELIYEVDATVPKELNGNVSSLHTILTKILSFICHHSDQKEILLSLSAPQDFFYREPLFFQIKSHGVERKKLAGFLTTGIDRLLAKIEGDYTFYDKDSSDLHLTIPFKLKELGMRRYYRLPNISMMRKKVLLLCQSRQMALSIRKMFDYFRYEVDIDIESYRQKGGRLSEYDIVVVEDVFVTEKMEEMIARVQQTAALHYVILQAADREYRGNDTLEVVSLVRPIMQESIFELIQLLYHNEVKRANTHVTMKKYLDTTFPEAIPLLKGTEEEDEKRTEDGNGSSLPILDTEEGRAYTEKTGKSYLQELEQFIESFNRSDFYFRQAVQEKSTWKIKEFCIELEKQSKVIGAKRMLDFAGQVSVLFVYDQLDRLPVYVNRYHQELKALLSEIERYLR